MIKVRENYYNFSHCSFPKTVFMYGKTVIENILADKNEYISSLKRIWKSTPLEDKNHRRKPPSFDIIVRKGTDEYSFIIISQPEAVKYMETPFICIAYDKDFKLRYFTYEISKAENSRKIYFLCEWTPDWSHINHNYSDFEDMNSFVELVSSALTVPVKQQLSQAGGRDTYEGISKAN